MNELTPYAQELLARSEQKALAKPKGKAAARKADPPATASKPAPTASAIEKFVPVEVEILLKIEERGAQRFGLGAAFCTQGSHCPRAIAIALNRLHQPLLRQALLGSDAVAVGYFAALLLATFLNYRRENAVFGALIQKLKVDAGAAPNPGWRPSHLALADIVCLSKPFESFKAIPIYGEQAPLGEIHVLGKYTLEVPASAASEVWQRFDQQHDAERSAAQGGAL